MIQQEPLRVQSSAEARETAIAADDAVAGDHDGKRVGAIGRTDGANGGRLPDASREVRVADRLSERDLTQGRPDRSLKGGARGSQSQVETLERAVEVVAELRRRACEERVVSPPAGIGRPNLLALGEADQMQIRRVTGQQQ